jgi:hypothetical protein
LNPQCLSKNWHVIISQHKSVELRRTKITIKKGFGGKIFKVKTNIFGKEECNKWI